MMTNHDSSASHPSQPTQTQHQPNLPNGQQQPIFNWTYNINNANFTAEQAAAQFFPFLPTAPPTRNTPNQTPAPAPLFADFNATNPYYYQTAAGAVQPLTGTTARPVSSISPLDLKYATNAGSDVIEQTLGSSSTDGSPFEFNGNGANVGGGVQGPTFYNIQDNYLSAMSMSADSYPSTSFMGMGAYPNYYPYQPTVSNGTSISAMDTLMQQQQQMATSMVQQWKYGNGAEKFTKNGTHSIKTSNSSGLSHRPPNPPHKIGPGTNNVRVRTIDKYRTVYTDRQRLELEKEFRSNHFVTTERKAVLAGELQLTERQVKIWFQNRRAKSRKQEPTHRSLRMVSALRQ